MTNAGENPRLRYDEGCLAAHALNAVGDRWALLVVRELMLKPKRFQAIRAGLPGISAAVLAQRLTQLAAAGVVTHDPELGTYALTPSGRALRPVLIALCRWGSQHPGHDPRRLHQPDRADAVDGRQHRPGAGRGAATSSPEWRPGARPSPSGRTTAASSRWRRGCRRAAGSR